ncbi:hypothetical protein LPJ73_002425 [Coemansia sp. RSA 2703]|nr:hypothetical protein LPJ73_002425 [Coemansia sp. RSA 2703]KAJ2378000.1 hypothetical protein IW150_001058 [Coemansia sp. RSA 2607]KAJ2397386.1 hypothetical protein GGI05_000664 [Coemansia sp. RSA 2603]
MSINQTELPRAADTSSPLNSASSSNASSIRGTEEEGDSYIKETDDKRINKKMGVGACALHPCLTRRATARGIRSETVAKELAAEQQAMWGLQQMQMQQRHIRQQAHEPEGRKDNVGGESNSVAAAEAGADDRQDRDAESCLVDLLAEHCRIREAQKDAHAVSSAAAATTASAGVPLAAKDTAAAESMSTSSMPPAVAAISGNSFSTGDVTQQIEQTRHGSLSPTSSNASMASLRHGMRSTGVQSETGPPGAATPITTSSGARLTHKRKELAIAGLRHSEATANAVRNLERGLNVRGGTETPTVDLVQTAVSVREVSKLIGRTVVQMNNVQRIMIVTKPNDISLVSLTRDLAIWLMESRASERGLPLVVYVEENVARHRNFNLSRVQQKHPITRTNLQYWTAELCAKSPEIFDFAVTLGGDGTVLYTSWLFQTTVPPIIPFHLGSLGFLTVFDHRHARRVLDSAIHSGVRINLRMRFTCTVYRLAETVDPERANVLNDAADCNRVIDHELATYGLQSFDGRGSCDQGIAEAEENADVSGSAKLAAISSLSSGHKLPPRSYSALMKGGQQTNQQINSQQSRPPLASRTNSSNSISRGNTHARRRSSLKSSSSSGHEQSSADDDDSNDGLKYKANRSGSNNKRTSSSGGPLTSSHRQPLRSVNSSASAGGSARNISSGSSSLGISTGSMAKTNVRSASKSKLSTGISSRDSIQEEEEERNQTISAINSSETSPAIRPENILPVADAKSAQRVSTLNESEWDDMPRAYQRRVRKVWKRDSTFQVMNEVVVDRGPSPYLSQIELYGDGNHLTTVEADGLCLATPTGSTAYSLAAGGSLVHPEIPAILVTPICAHTLSFRPMLLPDSMVLRVVLPPDSRNTAWASFDGRHRIELRRGDHIQITASKYPLPTVCASQSQTQDWMSSLSRCLNWNERKRQKKFTATSMPGKEGMYQEDELSEEGGNVGDEGSEPEDDEEREADDDADILAFK